MTEGAQQTPKSPIPVPPIPDWAGNRESGSRLAANREIGDTLRLSESQPLCVSTSCTILGWMLP